MTRKALCDTLKIYGFKMIKPSFSESDETGCIMFYAYIKCAGIVYHFYIDPVHLFAEATMLSSVCKHEPDDVSNMFFA